MSWGKAPADEIKPNQPNQPNTQHNMPNILPNKIRLTSELDAFGVCIPGTCDVPGKLTDAIMADPARFLSTLIPIGTKGNWINPEPIMHAGKPYWIKVWSPDDDSLVSECSVYDRDWSYFDPWYVG